MPLFEQTIDVNEADIQQLIHRHYDAALAITRKIKGSQNHTYEAKDSRTNESFAIRVTPDLHNKQLCRILLEIDFVLFLKQSKQVDYICAPIAAKDGRHVVKDGDFVVVVLEWGRGQPIDFIAYEWLQDEGFVFDWGSWFAKCHRVSESYSALFPEKVKDFQSWEDLHDGVLRGCIIAEEDQAVSSDPKHWGVVHGDLNLSNFFHVREERTLAVFDWDQTQRAWYLWDLAQALVAVIMLSEAGSVVDGSAVPNINREQFEEWLIAGYESIAGKGSVDRERLARMLQLRLSLYERFCRRAVEEGDIPKDMEHFIRYIVGWFDRRGDRTRLE